MVPGRFRVIPVRFRVVPGRFRVGSGWFRRVLEGSGWVPGFTYSPSHLAQSGISPLERL